MAHFTSLGMGSEPRSGLAKRLVDLAPGDWITSSSPRRGDGGRSRAEDGLSVLAAVDRPQPKKTKFVALGEAYHGDTLGSASVGGVARFHALFEPLLFEVIRAPIPDPRLAAGHFGRRMRQALSRPMERLLEAHHEELPPS